MVTTVEQLTERLRTLQIETARTIELLDRALRDERDERQAPAANREPAAVAVPIGNPFADVYYRLGDEVTITNGTRRNHSPHGTVTRVTENRVYLTTDDNQHTWRAPRNLRLTSRR